MLKTELDPIVFFQCLRSKNYAPICNDTRLLHYVHYITLITPLYVGLIENKLQCAKAL